MTRVLVLCQRVPWPLDDGHALRVYELVRHADPGVTCHLACLPSRVEGLEALVAQRICAGVTLLPPRDPRRHWRRLLRIGARDYQRLTYPRQYAAATRLLQEIVDRERIDVVVAVLQRCEEFARPVRGAAKLVDQYDCVTLAHERLLRAGENLSWRDRLRLRIRIAEARSIERGLGDRCDLITAISPPDVTRLQQLNPGHRVALVPNGVRRDLLDRRRTAEPTRRGVAFWGNLSFPVNRQAALHFYREVWRPYLEDEGVEFAIVGPHAGPDLQALAGRHAGVVLPGFVDDLFAFLERYPVMINPMVSGSGLKNKALEAFASGMAVVSTALGVDAFPVRDGEHCLVADEPAAMAEAVLSLLDDRARREDLAAGARRMVEERYTWEVVGSAWSDLLMKLGGVQLR